MGNRLKFVNLDMKKIILFFLLILILLIGLNSCKKNSDNLDQNTYYITNQNWTISTIRQYTTSIGWIDIFSSLAVCQKDNILIFKSDNSYIWDSGPIKCDSSDPQIVDYGNWSFSSNRTKLSTTSANGTSMTSDIYLLDDLNLITVIQYISGNDTTITETKYIH